MREYDPADHYWIVGDHKGRDLYSSAAGAYVPRSDAAYMAWSDDGGVPTSIATWAELKDVLSVQGPVARQARELLAASDVTVIRCVELGIAVPQAWRDYRAALRAALAGDSGVTSIPERPAFPEA